MTHYERRVNLEDLKKARWYIDYLIEHGEGDK